MREIAVSKVALKPGYAAHRQTEQRGRLGTRAGHQFSTRSANIHHQTAIVAPGSVRHALIYQTRFFFTADDLHRAAENFLRFGNKIDGINRQTERRGRDNADLGMRYVLQTLCKEAQTLPATFHGFGREVIIAAQARRQADLALDARQRLYASRHLAYNQHMKTIRTEINCRIKRGGTEHHFLT